MTTWHKSAVNGMRLVANFNAHADTFYGSIKIEYLKFNFNE